MLYVKFYFRLCVIITLGTGFIAGQSYEFSYAVKDDFGNDFGHKAKSDGDLVTGEYRTLLPDGRLQVVKYQADSKSGYNAQVSYLDNEDNSPTILRTSPGRQKCADGTIGVYCNPKTAVEDTIAEDD